MNKPLILLFVALSVLAAPSADAQTEKEVAAVVDKHISGDDFSGVVVVGKNGSKVYEKISGYADEETKVPLTKDTRSSIGSIGKFFTGILVMQLVDENKIKLDEVVNTYLPEWNVPNGDKIKISHLLTHSSGLGGYMGSHEHKKLHDANAGMDDQMKILVAAPLGFDEPGSKFQYSNSGFIVLGKIIEKLEGKSYFRVLQDRILIPLNMDHSTFTVDFNDPKGFAKGYKKDLNGTSIAQTSIIPPASDGGLFTTSDDLLKFDRAVFEKKIISERRLKEMETPRLSAYGYATIVTKIENGIGYGHNGGMPGYEADYRHFFIGNDQYTVIILSNHDRKAIRMMMDLQQVLAGIH